MHLIVVESKILESEKRNVVWKWNVNVVKNVGAENVSAQSKFSERKWNNLAVEIGRSDGLIGTTIQNAIHRNVCIHSEWISIFQTFPTKSFAMKTINNNEQNENQIVLRILWILRFSLLHGWLFHSMELWVISVYVFALLIVTAKLNICLFLFSTARCD